MTLESYQYIFDANRLFYEELSEDMLSDAISWELSMHIDKLFRGNPPEEVIDELSNEFSNMKAEDAVTKVAILYELTSWLRRNGFSFKCSHQSYALFYLDIVTDPSEKQMSEYFKNIPARPSYVIDVQEEAFAALGQLFKNHWIEQLDEDAGFFYHLDDDMHPIYGEIAGVMIYPMNKYLVQ